MKKCYNLLVPLLLGYGINAQVGINTDSPKSTLDVQASTTANYPDGIIPPRITADALKAKESAYGPDHNGAIVYVTSALTSVTGAIKTLNITSPGTYIYDSNFANPGGVLGTWNKLGVADPSAVIGAAAYAARAEGNIQLINLGLNLLGSAVNTLPLNTPSPNFITEIASPYVTNNAYTVPITGLYHINYSFRTGQGVSAELLSGVRPGLIVTKTPSGATAPLELDHRYFGSVSLLNLGSVLGVGLVVANITLTQGQISHVYQLNAGDVIQFGIVQGGLNLGLISDKSTEIAIYRIH